MYLRYIFMIGLTRPCRSASRNFAIASPNENARVNRAFVRDQASINAVVDSKDLPTASMPNKDLARI